MTDPIQPESITPVVATGLCWGAALATGALGVLMFGALPGLSVGLAAAVAASVATGVLAASHRRSSADALASLGEVLGLSERNYPKSTDEAARLLQSRLARVKPGLAAFEASRSAQIIVGDGGELIAASAGMRALVPDLPHRSDVIEPMVNTTDAPDLSRIGGTRYRIVRTPLGIGTMLIELQPAGVYVEEMQVSAVAGAIASERPDFRFTPEAANANAALEAYNLALGAIEGGIAAIDRALGGNVTPQGDAETAFTRRSDAVVGMVRAERARVTVLEAKLEAIAALIEALGGTSDPAIAGLGEKLRTIGGEKKAPVLEAVRPRPALKIAV